MRKSSRSLRIKRHYGRMHQAGGLNLVSLMDIFTILVFFLMVNSSDVKVLQNPNDVPLPTSTAEQIARDTLIVQVTGRSVLVQGREVARTDGIESGDRQVTGLAEELAYRRAQRTDIPEEGLPITIMASKKTSYRLLRTIMQTCVDEQFRQVRLAVVPEVVNG